MYSYSRDINGNILQCVSSDFSLVRVFHASPDAPTVDVYIDQFPIAKNLDYKNFSYYVPVPVGNYDVEVYPAGDENDPVLSINIDVPGGQIITVAATGNLDDLTLLPIIDDATQMVNEGEAKVRFYHLSPDAPEVYITANGNELFENISFREGSEYADVPSGSYNIQAYPIGANEAALSSTININEDKIYTIYAIGSADSNSEAYLAGNELEVIQSVDGNTFVKQC